MRLRLAIAWLSALSWSCDHERAAPPAAHVIFESAADGCWVREQLVLGGRVVPAKSGLAGLADYLRATGFLQRPAADADAFLRLAYYFDAFPPASHSSGFHTIDDPSHPELRPRLVWDARGSRFILNYTLSSASPPGVSRGFSDRLPIEEWTLLIPFNYDLVWQRRTFDADR